MSSIDSPFVIDITNLEQIASYLKEYLTRGEHPLEPLQSEVIEDIVAEILTGYNCGYVKKPTGTGKTVIFCALFDALRPHILNSFKHGHGGGLILVDTTNAAEQTYETLTEKLRRDGSGKKLFGWNPKEVAIYYGSGRNSSRDLQQKALDSSFVIMTRAAHLSLTRSGRLVKGSRPFVIIDEVDANKGKVLTPHTRELTASSFAFGFSATHSFVGPDGLVTIGPQLFGRDKPTHETSPLQAAERGEISPIRNILFVTNLRSGIEKRLAGSDREYTDVENKIIADQWGRDDEIIRSVISYVDPDTGIAFKDLNSIWFAANVKHAERISGRLNLIFQKKLPDGSLFYPNGYAVLVSGDTPKEDWTDKWGHQGIGLKSILHSHRQSIIPALSNADLLIRSFDSASTYLCVMMRATRSPPLTEQTGGRVSRPDPQNPRKLAYVATVLDEDMEAALTYTDIVGDSKLGMKAGVSYGTQNEPREVFLDKLESAPKIKIKIYADADEIKAFLAPRARRRSENEAKFRDAKALADKIHVPEMPNSYVTANDLARTIELSLSQANLYLSTVWQCSSATENRSGNAFNVGNVTYSKHLVGCFRHPDHKNSTIIAVHESYLPAIEAWFNRVMVQCSTQRSLNKVIQALAPSANKATPKTNTGAKKKADAYSPTAPRTERINSSPSFIRREISSPTSQTGDNSTAPTKKQTLSCVMIDAMDPFFDNNKNICQQLGRDDVNRSWLRCKNTVTKGSYCVAHRQGLFIQSQFGRDPG